MVPNEVRTRTMLARLDDGIMHITYLPSVQETVADAEENARAGTAAWGERPWPMLIDARAIKSQSREVRQYHSRPEAFRRARALAVLVDSPLSRVVVNFFITLTKPPVPTRLFRDEAEAREWLKGFVE